MMIRSLAPLLVLSGIASLTYQVIWVRLLGLSMGATSAAVSTVVAAFFLGLSLGSYLVARRPRWLRHPLRSYVALEALIGTSGLVLLPVLLNLDRLVAVFPALGASLAFKFCLTELLLLVPTAAMGATFPVLAQCVASEDAKLGGALSDLYGFNTFGAVLGATLSGFVLIPRLGLDGASLVAASANAGAAALGWRLSRRGIATAARERLESSPITRPSLTATQLRVLVVLATTGFVAIAVEVAWTKYLVIFVGTTIYGFSAILAAVLLGVALGSWSVRRWIDRWQAPRRWLMVGLGALGLSLMLTRSGLGVVTRWDDALVQRLPDWGVLGARYVLVLLVVLPSTWMFGALFPVCLKLLCAGADAPGVRVGRAYAVNTLAGIAGSTVAGFWWLPSRGTSHLLLWTALLILATPLLFWRDLMRPRARVVPLVFAAAAGVGALLPAPDYSDLVAWARLDRSLAKRQQRTVFLSEGMTGVVSIDALGRDRFNLYNNGMNESRINVADPYDALLMESMLGIFPYFLHERPRTAFVVGLGGGATLRALEYTAIESLRVVELEPRIREALLSIASPRTLGFDDPRLTLSFNDARNTLLVEPTQYDLIVSQPSHPWRAGAASLFTREFFEIAKSRLAKGGIYGQWLALYRMDSATLRAIMRAFVEVFPHAFAIANEQTSDMLFFGSLEPLRFTPGRLYPRAKEQKVAQLLERQGVHDPVQLLTLFSLSRAAMQRLSADAPLSTDTNLLPEVRLAGLAKTPRGDEAPATLLRNAGFDILPYLDPKVQSVWLQQLALDLKQFRGQRASRAAIAELAKVDASAARRLQRLQR